MLQVLVYVVLLVDMVGYQVYWVTPYHQYLNQYWVYNGYEQSHYAESSEVSNQYFCTQLTRETNHIHPRQNIFPLL